MKTKSVCAIAALVALAIASAPAMARGGRGGGGGGSKSKSSYSSTARSTAKVVKAVAKSVKPKTTQQRSSSTPVGNSSQSNAAPTQPTTNQGGLRPGDCLPPKPNFDPVRGICVEI